MLGRNIEISEAILSFFQKIKILKCQEYQINQSVYYKAVQN
jgi:hypothetical protein